MALHRSFLNYISSKGTPAQTASGSFSHGSTTETVTTNHGFVPDMIIIRYTSGSTESIDVISTEINGNEKPIITFSGSVQGTKYALGNTTNWRVSSYTDTTMTVNKTSGATVTYYWYAYKWSGGSSIIDGLEIIEDTFVGGQSMQYTITSQYGKTPHSLVAYNSTSSNKVMVSWMKPLTWSSSQAGASDIPGTSAATTTTKIYEVGADYITLLLPSSVNYGPGTWKYIAMFE